MKKLIIIIILWILLTLNLSFAADNPGFEVIPESEQSSSSIGDTVKSIWVWGEVIDNYKNKAYWTKIEWSNVRAWSDMSLWDQFASGVMTWDTILDYAVYLVKFIWQLALLVWALMIIYLWYKKATEHIKFNGTIGKVVIWILVISFAYVIVKIIWSMFIS